MPRRRKNTRLVEDRKRMGRKHLTAAEWRAVLNAARGDLRDFALLLTLYEGALRRAEVGRLTLADCTQLHQRKLYVHRGKGSKDGWVDLSRTAQAALAAWIDFCYPDRASRKPGWFLFPGARRCRVRKPRAGLGPGAVYGLVEKWCRQVGLHPLLCHPHVIKHTRVMHLLAAAETKGLGPEAMLALIASIVGHKNTMTTFRYYMGVTERQREIARDITDDIFAKED